MQVNSLALAVATAFPWLVSSVLAQNSLPAATASAPLQIADAGPIKSLGTVTVQGGQPTSLPTQISATIERITREQIERSINATDSEDALKYFPSLLVRKRYIGDYDHAVLATRASGTGNSARSLVYADGILLSNLLGNGASFTPRWGLVTPEEIERVDVLYGPFSAAYPGNSVGAVVDYVTRLPTQFEAHAAIGGTTQRYQQYATDERFSASQASASLGNRAGALAWWFNVNRLRSNSQPLFFGNPLVASGAPGSGGTPVTGAVPYLDPQNRPGLITGDNSRIRTVQDHIKIKLAHDLSATLRASYVLGYWANEAERGSQTYLRDAAGNPVFAGPVNIDGRQFTLAATQLSLSQEQLAHVAHGLSLRSRTQGEFDYELAASVYDYGKNQVRTPLVALPGAARGGAGRINDQRGTGWNTLAAKGIWRPGAGSAGSTDSTAGQRAHVVDLGVQRDAFKLRTRVSNTADWMAGAPADLFSAFAGQTALTSVYAQDTWQFAPRWKSTLGLRYEQWQARDGTIANASSTLRFGERTERNVSPKVALGYQLTPAWTLRASAGRAVRYPTVSELYQGSIASGSLVNNDPNLRPERSLAGEFSAEHDLGHGSLRLTLFREDARDALYAQTNTSVFPSVTNIQNVGRIRTHGLELVFQATDVMLKGLELASSLTLANSIIKENGNFPASVGKRQPRVPDVRANLLLTWQSDSRWSYTLGARYSGEQFNTLDNSDPNGDTLAGTSRFFVADVRVRYRWDKHWSASVGVDNLGNSRYWAFHPYPQRSYSAELKFDL